MVKTTNLFLQWISTTAYHPQTDGLVKRFNRTLMGNLAKKVRQNGSDWDLHLPYVLFAYKVSTQESTQESPFFLLHGRDQWLPSFLSHEVRLILTPREERVNGRIGWRMEVGKEACPTGSSAEKVLWQENKGAYLLRGWLCVFTCQRRKLTKRACLLDPSTGHFMLETGVVVRRVDTPSVWEGCFRRRVWNPVKTSVEDTLLKSRDM